MANRRDFEERLQDEWSPPCRNQSPIALIIGDIDYFEQYNDRLGHVAGDECLKMVGRAIRSCVKRGQDLAARYRGEEYALLLPDTPVGGGIEVARNVRAAVEALGISHRASPIGDVVIISLGIVSLSCSHNIPPASLVERADAALYKAKTAGRNRIAANG